MRKFWLLILMIFLPGCQEEPVNSGPAGPFYDNHLYLELYGQLLIIDVADPGNPIPVGYIATEDGRWERPQVIGDHLLVTRYDLVNSDQEHYLFDLDTPTEPELAHTIQASGERSIALYDNHGIMIHRQQGSISLQDFTDPSRPKLETQEETEVSGHVLMTDGFAVAANLDWCSRTLCLSGVDFFTWSADGDLTFIHTVPLNGRLNTRDFIVRETEFLYYELARLPDSYRTMIRIIDLARPVHDNHVAEHDIGGRPIFLSDSLLLVQEFTDENEFTVRLLDISDSYNFIELSTFIVPGLPNMGIVEDGILYIAYDGYSGSQAQSGRSLYVLDISDPTAPELLANRSLE